MDAQAILEANKPQVIPETVEQKPQDIDLSSLTSFHLMPDIALDCGAFTENLPSMLLNSQRKDVNGKRKGF